MLHVLKVIKTHRLLSILLAIAVFAGSYAGYTQVAAAKAPETAVQTVTVERGNLRLAVSASGSVTSPRAVDLSFRQSGVVEEVYVQVGDAVAAGQPLAKLETQSLEFQVRQAEIGQRTAQLSLDALLAGARPEDIQAANASLESARAKLSTMEAQGELGTVAVAEAGLQTARARLDLLANPTVADVANAHAAVETAAASLQSAQAKLAQVRNPAPADIRAAENNLAAAQAKLLALRNPTASELASAQASVASAEANLASSRTKLDQLKNPTADKVADAQAAVKGAENALWRAQSDLDTMKLELNDEKVRNLINAYLDLFMSRQKLNEDRSRNAPIEQVAADEEAVLRALRRVEAAEADTNSYKPGHTALEIQAAVNTATKAQVDLEAAKLRLEKLLRPLAADLAAAQNDIASAEASLHGATAKLEQLRNPSPADLVSAESSVSKAQADLDKLRNPQASDIASAEASVASAQANVTSAQAKLALLLDPSPADIAAARSALVQAENQLLQAQLPYKDADLTSQRASVQQAMASLNKTAVPSTAQDLAKAQLSVDRAQLDLDQALYNLQHAVLRAPFDAIVSKVAAFPGGQPTSVTTGSAGSSSGGGASITIVDPNGMQVQVSVDESDVGRLQLGQAADITVEAAGARPYRGWIVAIAPSGTVQSGVTTYQVLLALELARPAATGGERGSQAPSPASGGPGQQRPQGTGGQGQGGGQQRPQRGGAAASIDGAAPTAAQLRAGMTAVANIVYAERESVLLAPNRAIKRSGQERTVEVQVDGRPERRTVRTGLSDDQRTEVTEGLQEGDLLLVEAPRTGATAGQQQGQRPFGAVGGLGGGVPGGGLNAPIRR